MPALLPPKSRRNPGTAALVRHALDRRVAIAAVLGCVGFAVALAPLQAARATASTITVTASADTYVAAGSPASNYGQSASLRIVGSPVARAYLRFDAGAVAGSITRATLNVYAKSRSTAGFEVRRVSTGTWSEETTTYSNAPAPDATAGPRSGPFSGSTWVSVDVTALVADAGIVDLALLPGSQYANFSLASSEAGAAYAPQLVLETSDPTTSATTTTTTAPSSRTFVPTGDAFVHEWQPSGNFGEDVLLKASSSPKLRSFLRFDVSGLDGAVSKATLLLKAVNTDLLVGVDVYGTDGRAWDESTITYGTAPGLTATPVAARLRLVAGAWTAADVTSLVTGNGRVDLALATGTPSTELRMSSREAGGDAGPRLVVETGTAPPPPTAPPLNLTVPTLSGVAQDGALLAASPGTWSGSPTSYAWSWRRCDALGALCVAIPGATSSTYAIGTSDVGSRLAVAVTAANDSGTATAMSLPTAVVAARPASTTPSSCRRPYSDSSPWNTPLAADPALDPDSPLYVSYLVRNTDQNILTSDPTQYSYPVFLVDATTPVRTVRFNVNNPYGYGSGTYSNVFGGGSDPLLNLAVTQGRWSVTIPVPPDTASAMGSDGQAVILNPVTGDEWAFWQLMPDPSSPGNFVATNGYHYNTLWNGAPPKGFGSRGPGMTYTAGLIRPCEIMQGHIDHAIAFAYRSPSAAWVYPATKSDGDKFGDAFPEIAGVTKRMPEGARLQLDPALTDAELGPLTDRHGNPCSTKDGTGAWRLTPCLVIAHALQRYGMIVADHSGRSKIYAEYSDCVTSPCSGWTAHWGQTVDGTAIPALDQYTANPIPVASLRVIKLGPLNP